MVWKGIFSAYMTIIHKVKLKVKLIWYLDSWQHKKFQDGVQDGRLKIS